MFKIGLRSGSPVSAGHMIEVPGSGAATYKFQTGDLICIKDGGADYPNSNCPDALVSSAEYEGNTTKTATVMLLTEDMILEAPVKGSDAQIQGLSAGKFIGYGMNDVNAADTSKYCQVVDTLGAKTEGDKILVRFLHNNVGPN